MIGKRLKELREEKGITQEQLGKLVNLSQQTIGHYEVNRAKPDIETIEKLAEYFNVSTDYLLGRTNNRKDSAPTLDDELNAIMRELGPEATRAGLWPAAVRQTCSACPRPYAGNGFQSSACPPR